MTAFDSISVRPYQLLCLICRQGRRPDAALYPHEARLAQLLELLRNEPAVPLTLRCNTDTVFSFQNPGRGEDTAEGPLYNDLRDLTVLRKIGLVPGATLPAIDIFIKVFKAIASPSGICAYPESEAPGWPRCRFADTGNLERGLAGGIAAIIPGRTEERLRAVKQDSAKDCLEAGRLRIRPHHLLCMTCFHAGRQDAQVAPIPEDNLAECIEAMRRNPEIPVELIHGPCMVCPPCQAYHEPSNRCIGGQCMGLRDDKKDLDTLRRLGLRYGDVLPARELLSRLYAAIETTTMICGHGDGVAGSPEWRICGGSEGHAGYISGRRAGLGVRGAAPCGP